MAETPLQPATLEERARRSGISPKEARKNIPKAIADIKSYTSDLKSHDYIGVNGLRSMIDNLEVCYSILKDEDDIKKHWGNVQQTLKRLRALSDKLEDKYDALIAELDKNNAFDALIEELDHKT